MEFVVKKLIIISCPELDASNQDPRNAPILTFKNSALRPYTAFLCFIRLLAKTIIIYFPQTALTGWILPRIYRVSSENKESLFKNIQKILRFHIVMSHLNIVLPSRHSLPGSIFPRRGYFLILILDCLIRSHVAYNIKCYRIYVTFLYHHHGHCVTL